MVLRDMDIKPDTVCYIGAIDGSNFFWIGRRKDVPEQYLDAPVDKTDNRTVDIPGTIILLEGDGKEFFGGKEPSGYWYWHECDPTAPRAQETLRGSPLNFENLLIAIVKTEGYWYKNELRKALDSVHHDMDRAEAEKLVRSVHVLCRPHLVMLPESSVGRYIIQRIEDDAMARAMHDPKEWSRMDYDDRAEQEEKMHKKLIRERVRQQEKRKVYATIKGRSVKHERNS